MRIRQAAAALLALTILLAGHMPARAIIAPPPNPTPPPTRPFLPPLGWYALGSVGCAAGGPIFGTMILGRALTATEAYQTTLSCLLGPPGWLLGSLLTSLEPPPPPPPPSPPQPTFQQKLTRGGHVDIPPRGLIAFVPNEILVEADAGDAARLEALLRRLQLTRLEIQTFTLTGRTLQRWHIDGNATVRVVLQQVANLGGVNAQANYLYILPQQEAAKSDAGPQYVVGKLHLTEAHRVSTGNDVVVAVIDSKIDTKHPDLAGVIAGEEDVLGSTAPAHMHGTAMAGAIAAHSNLVGVAPKVKLLAVRAFSGTADSAQGTTFNILKGLDWAASQNARIVNMSFAGPADTMLRDMVAKAYARGIVLIAAVGNAGPRSPPLYPAAYPDVIGVTATDADDRLLPQANRGPQVAVAAPGVDVLADAPDDKFQITSGTSIATAHVSGVVALMLAREPNLTPGEVRKRLIASARVIPGQKRDVGAGVIDALRAIQASR